MVCFVCRMHYIEILFACGVYMRFVHVVVFVACACPKAKATKTTT